MPPSPVCRILWIARDREHTQTLANIKTGNRGAPTVFREFIGLHAKRVQAGLRRRAYAGPELASLLPR